MGKFPKIQGHMNAAYAKWSKSWSYLTFLDHLAGNEKFAVVIGNLNYQVENGGFLQWIDNGYHKGADVLLRFLAQIDNEVARSIMQIVQAALHRGKDDLDDLDDLDDRYYALQSQFLSVIETVV